MVEIQTTKLSLGFFLLAKYANSTHPLDAQVINISSVWRRLVKHRGKAKQHIRWLVGAGEIDDVNDNWLDGIICQFNETKHAKDVFINNVQMKQTLGET